MYILFIFPHIIDTAEYVYEGQLSLVQMYGMASNTQSISEGKLRVYLNGKWTSVCNETFGNHEAECSCKQLGYTGHISYDHDPSGYNAIYTSYWQLIYDN